MNLIIFYAFHENDCSVLEKTQNNSSKPGLMASAFNKVDSASLYNCNSISAVAFLKYPLMNALSLTIHVDASSSDAFQSFFDA